MVQRGSRSSLGAKALTHRRVRRPRRRQHLQRDFALELFLIGQVDRAHATAAEQTGDAVVAQALGHVRGLANDAGEEVQRIEPTEQILALGCRGLLQLSAHIRASAARGQQIRHAAVDHAGVVVR